MRNQEILKKAIEKALDNGWDTFIKPGKYEVLPTLRIKVTIKSGAEYSFDYEHFIFSHKFAKALWGDNPVVFNAEQYPIAEDGEESTLTAWHSSLPGWQYHLQQMVISDDPIKYLADNI